MFVAALIGENIVVGAVVSALLKAAPLAVKLSNLLLPTVPPAP